MYALRSFLKINKLESYQSNPHFMVGNWKLGSTCESNGSWQGRGSLSLSECSALWSEISQLRDWVPLSNCHIYCMWQLFPSYVFKTCFCMLWETKFGCCYWAGLRCVKISIRSSGVKTFMTCPLVPSRFTWWFLILPCLFLPSTTCRLLDPALQCFLFPYPSFLVWCILFPALWWQWYCLGGKFMVSPE